MNKYLVTETTPATVKRVYEVEASTAEEAYKKAINEEVEAKEHTVIEDKDEVEIDVTLVSGGNNMELLSCSSVVEKEYRIQHKTEGVLFYKEWLSSENGKCIDFVLQSKDGYEITDAGLVEEIQAYVDILP